MLVGGLTNPRLGDAAGSAPTRVSLGYAAFVQGAGTFEKNVGTENIPNAEIAWQDAGGDGPVCGRKISQDRPASRHAPADTGRGSSVTRDECERPRKHAAAHLERVEEIYTCRCLTQQVVLVSYAVQLLRRPRQ